MEGAKLSIHELQQLLASVTSMVRDNAARTEEIAATVNRIAASPFDPRISRGMTEARAEAATPPTTTPAVATTTASTKLVAASDGIAPTPASTGLDHDLGRNLAAVARPCAGCMSAAPSGVPPTPTCRPAVVLELDIKAPTRCSIICSDDMDMPAVRPGVTSNIKYERKVLRPRPWPSFVGDQAAHGLTPYHGESANTDEAEYTEKPLHCPQSNSKTTVFLPLGQIGGNNGGWFSCSGSLTLFQWYPQEEFSVIFPATSPSMVLQLRASPRLQLTNEVYLWEEMASYNCAKDQAIFFFIEHSSYPTLVAVKFKQLCSVNVLSVGENCHAILDSEIVQLSDCELISMEEPLSCLRYVQLQVWCPPDQSKYEAEKLWSLLYELVSVVELWQSLSDGPLLALWTPPSQQGFSQTGVKGISCIGTFTTHTDCLMISMDFIHIALIGSEAIQRKQVNYKGLQSYTCCIVQPLKGAEYLVHCDATYELDLERLALVRKLQKTDHCGFHWKTMLQTVVVRGLVPTTTTENNGSINSVCADEDGVATRKKRGVLVQRRDVPWDPSGSAWCRQFSPGYNQSLFKEGGVSQQLWPPPSSKSPPATSTTFEFDQVCTGNGCYLDAASLTFADAPFWHERLTMGHPSQALVLISVQSLFLCGFATSCLWSGILESGNQLEFFGRLLITYAQGEYLCIGSVGVQPEWWCSSGNECLNPRGSILHGMENQLPNAKMPGLVSISTIEGFNTTGDVTKSQLINSLTLTSKKGSQAPIYITYRAMQVRETRSVLISFASGSAPYFPEEGSPKSGKQFNESWGAQYVPTKQDGGISTEIYEEILLVLDGGAGNLKDKMELWNRSADSQLLRVDEFKGREHMAANCIQFGQNWYHSMRSAQTQFSYLPPVLHLIWGTAQISLQKAQYLIKWHCIRVGLSPWEILKICKQTRSSGVLPPPNDPMRGWTSVLPWKMSRNYSQVTYGNTSGMQVPRRKVGEPMSVVLSCVFAAAPRPEPELGLLTRHATKFFAEVAIGRDKMVRSAQHDLYTFRRGYWCLVPFELSWISDRYVENILELSATSAYGSDLSHHWTTLGMSNKEEQYQGPTIILGCPLAHEGAMLVMWVTSVLVAQTIDKQSTFSGLLAIGAELHAPWDPGGYNLQVCDYAGLGASRLLRRGECHVPTVTWDVGWTTRQARKAEAHLAD